MQSLLSPQADASLIHAVHAAVEEILNVLRWRSNCGECECPFHDPPRADALVFIDGRYPHLHCFGTSCEEQRAELNGELYDTTHEIYGQHGVRFERTPEERAADEERKRLRRLTANTRHVQLSRLKSEPPFALSKWERLSPYNVASAPVADHWRLMLTGLFGRNSEERIWIGELHQSGQPEHRACFRPVDSWLRSRVCPGPQTSPAVWKPLTYSREKGNVLGKRFVVAESDTVPREQFGNVLRWLQSRGMVLRSVVDTGGKSLHGWFDIPLPVRPALPRMPDRATYENVAAEKWRRRDGTLADGGFSVVEHINRNYEPEMAEWRATYGPAQREYERQQASWPTRWRETMAVLHGLGCDPAMFNLNATARLPGCERTDDEGNFTGRWQRLIYLNPKHPL